VFSDTPAKGIQADSGPVLTRTGDGGGDENSGGQPITICLSLQCVTSHLFKSLLSYFLNTAFSLDF
jgi:hypothetical protein